MDEVCNVSSYEEEVTVKIRFLPRVNLVMAFICCLCSIEVILYSSCPGVVSLFRAYGFNW